MGRVTLDAPVRFGLFAALGIFLLAAFNPPVDVLIVLSLILLLALRELAGRQLLAGHKVRVDFLIGLGALAFLVIVVKRVADILRA